MPLRAGVTSTTLTHVLYYLVLTGLGYAVPAAPKAVQRIFLPAARSA